MKCNGNAHEGYGNERTRWDPIRKARIAKAESAMVESGTNQKTALCAFAMGRICDGCDLQWVRFATIANRKGRMCDDGKWHECYLR